MRELILSPSILAADFTRLGEQIEAARRGGAKYLHFDVMDGMFVPNISIGTPVLKSVRAFTDITLDVHLMIENPARYVDTFISAGADIITFHLEAAPDPSQVIRLIKAGGKKAGLAIKPGTELTDILPYAFHVDMVLLMSVEPGFGGQRFLPQSLDKARRLRQYVCDCDLDLDIQMDGGISADNVREVVRSGVNVVVAGTAVFAAKDIARAAADMICLMG